VLVIAVLLIIIYELRFTLSTKIVNLGSYFLLHYVYPCHIIDLKDDDGVSSANSTSGDRNSRKPMRKDETKARVPVQKRGIRTRENIIRAARVLFESKGYHGTNSKEIAAGAGIAVGTFYSYFDDKKPLFLEVIRGYYREITEMALSSAGPVLAALESGKSGDLKKAVGRLIRMLYEAHNLSPALHREITAMIYGDGEVEEVSREEERKVRSLIRGILERVPGKLAVKDLDAAVLVVHRSAEEIIHSLRMFESDIAHERILGELEDMLARYLFAKG